MSSNLTDSIKKVLSDEQNVRDATRGHQSEFPYDREMETNVTRREFCNFLGLTSTTFFVGAAGFAGKAAIDARRGEAFQPLKVEGAGAMPVNSSINFKYPSPDEPAILVRASDGQFYAYGQKCTHLSCPVYYSPESEHFECPCHEAGFEAKTGNVIYGPPPRALDRIEIEVKDGEVWAKGVKTGGEA